MDSFKGRVAVVTGAGSGIGRGLSLAFAREGAKVVLADRDATRVAGVADEIHAATDGETLCVPTDVTDAKAVDALADAAFAEFGAVHVLCNNAGITSAGYSWETALSEWTLTLGVNLMGVVHGLRAFIPRMLAGGDVGRIVNTASMAGLIPVARTGSYTVGKHALVGLSKVLRAELESINSRIGVSVVCPGPVATRIMDDGLARYAAGPALAPAEMARLNTIKASIDGGISGEEAGKMIVEGIRSGRFWVFPNGKSYLPLVNAEFAEMFG